MRAFRRKSTDSNLPPEIQAYTEGAHRERMGMAWLVGIVSLVVTLIVVSGLFFGGRWVYRKLAHKDDKSTTAQTDTKKDDGKGSDNGAGKTNTNDSDNGSTDTPVQAPAPSPAPTPATPATTPATGDTSGSTLVRTGPDVDL